MYFTLLQRTNNPANALQREAAKHLEGISNRLIPDVTAFVDRLRTKIAALNVTHPRCMPLRLSVNKFSDSIHIYLGEHFTVDFGMFPVKDDMDDREVPNA